MLGNTRFISHFAHPCIVLYITFIYQLIADVPVIIYHVSYYFVTCTSCKIYLDKCSKIKKVGEPIVHHHSGYHQGTWMRDPLGLLGPEKIWYMNGYYGKKVLEFEDMDHFKAGEVAKTYTLIILMVLDLLSMDGIFTLTGLYESVWP